MSTLSALFAPMQVGPMQVANRIMMSGMSAGCRTDEQGEVSAATIAYFRERSRNTPGMIAVGAAAVVPPVVEPASKVRSGSAGMRLYADDMIPSLRKLVDAVKEHGSRFGIQLFNAGGTERGTAQLISPSGISSNVRDAREHGRKPSGMVNRALLLEEIPTIVEHYASAADRCRQAGFDFVEVHAGHGYLISNFLTPLFNRRTDRYGGAFDNRVRFLLEIVEAIRHRVGSRIGVGVKFNGDDFIGDEGWTIAESCRLAPLVQAAGADYITVTAGLVGSPRLTIPPMYEPQGCYVDMAEAVRAHVSIPVGTVGRIKDVRMAEDLVARDRVDFVVMGRAFIADPDFVGKARRGELADIRPCLADCRGCADEHIQRGGLTSCVVNPRMCRELDLVDVEGDKRDVPKKVLVVGGGLAGLEAARRTAFSGHRVTLLERGDALGGQIRLAARVPDRAELADILPWYERQLARHGVDVRLGASADEASIRQLAPDVVIVATGSVPEVPQHLLGLVTADSGIEVAMLDDVMSGEVEVGRRVLVIGGDQNGVLAADWLSQRGRKVWIAEAAGHFARKLAGHDRWYLFNRMAARGVERLKYVSAIEPAGERALALTTREGTLRLDDVDTIVFASDRRADRGVAEVANRLGIETHLVGDAFDAVSEQAGTIFANIARAYDVARRI